MKLPINPDQGFPQSFRLAFNGATYRVLLYVNAQERGPETAENHIYDLPETGAYMVMRVAREGPAGPQVVFQRKLVPNHEYQAAELVLVFRRMWVAKRNLNAPGSFGSQVIAGVAERWA